MSARPHDDNQRPVPPARPAQEQPQSCPATRIRLTEMAAVGETIAGFSHSLRNVLGMLRGGTYLVDSGLERQDLERIREGWDMVKKSHQFLSDLASRMLVLARERVLACETIEADELIDSVVGIMQAKAQERGVILRVHLDPALPFLTGDPICLRECLLNLMTNALEACDPGQGRVEIATTATGNGRFQISVRDNGRGIAPEDHDKLFQPFFTTKGREGLGLGLAVAHKIIREHRGEIQVESAPGQGTCFTLDLPLEPGLE